MAESPVIAVADADVAVGADAIVKTLEDIRANARALKDSPFIIEAKQVSTTQATQQSALTFRVMLDLHVEQINWQWEMWASGGGTWHLRTDGPGGIPAGTEKTGTNTSPQVISDVWDAVKVAALPGTYGAFEAFFWVTGGGTAFFRARSGADPSGPPSPFMGTVARFEQDPARSA